MMDVFHPQDPMCSIAPKITIVENKKRDGYFM